MKCELRIVNYNAAMLLAVVTISDRCSLGQTTDTAGPAVAELLRAHWPGASIETALLPDEEDAISAILEQFAADHAALVLTVGGTGFGPRDRTPEATRRIIDREAPGLGEAMRAQGAAQNKFSWLSRAVCGLKGSTVIVNLPGSQRGATESLTAILSLLKHAVDVAAGANSHP